MQWLKLIEMKAGGILEERILSRRNQLTPPKQYTFSETGVSFIPVDRSQQVYKRYTWWKREKG